MVIMQHTLIPLELNIFQKKLKKIKRQQKYYNKYRIKGNHSIMCGYFCIGFIDFMLKGKYLLDSTNLFSPNKYEKNGKIILTCFQ